MASEDVLQARVRQSDKLSKYITLSMTHITQADSVILKKLSRPYRDRHDESKWIDEEWVFDTWYGFILQLSLRDKRLATLHEEGVSAALCDLLGALTKDTGISFVLFDRDEELMKHLISFTW